MSLPEGAAREADDPQVRAAWINHRGIVITAALGAAATITASLITAVVTVTVKDSETPENRPGAAVTVTVTSMPVASAPAGSAPEASASTATYLADMQPIGEDGKLDKAWTVAPARVAATTYSKAVSATGLWCDSIQVDYVLSGQYRRFQAQVGMAVDSESTRPLNFYLLVDDKRVKTVGGVGIKEPQKVDVPIEGANRLALGIEPSEGTSFAVSSCPGPERVGVWIDPRVTP